jgi:hypothetical protein
VLVASVHVHVDVDATGDVFRSPAASADSREHGPSGCAICAHSMRAVVAPVEAVLPSSPPARELDARPLSPVLAVFTRSAPARAPPVG